GLGPRLIPVSAALRLAAATSGDAALDAESGFAELIDCLRRDVLAQPGLLAARAVAAAAGMVVEQLAAQLHQEDAALATGQTQQATARTQAAQEELERLRLAATRGQTALADEVGDLTADIDHDLRERTRRILREADRFFDDADPLRAWPVFE